MGYNNGFFSYFTNIIAIESQFTHSLSLKDDGTLWAWGDNTYGQLGNGTNIASNIPVQTINLCQVLNTSDKNFDNDTISVYPNPSNGLFQIALQNMEIIDGELDVYNIFGQRIYLTANIQQQMQIDLSNFSKAIYFIKIHIGSKIYNKKIVIQ